jgi:predicted O-methyltransferase YrrM
MSIVRVNKEDYAVNPDEFIKFVIPEYCNLKLHKDLSEYDTLLGFIKKIINIQFEKNINYKFIHNNPSHGGFIGLKLHKLFNDIHLTNIDGSKHLSNIRINKQNFSANNLTYDITTEELFTKINTTDFVIFLNDDNKLNEVTNFDTDKYIIISKSILNCNLDKYYYFKNLQYYVYVSNLLQKEFNSIFYYNLTKLENEVNIIEYDNLINLCIMVKNAGPQFREMLEENLQFIDKWTILDTGSTDDTVQIIKEVLVGKKEGNLYEEPFINFRDSRNRLLDLAGTDCKFIIMLDDTYILKGNIRSFLKEIRSDQYANSYTLYIESDDTKYGSNRIISSNSGLRYKFKIHEVITDMNNINIVIPYNKAYILDKRFDYMESRTIDRKQFDLKLLYEELEENPHEPRTYYYLAQTYNILNDYEKAFEYFIKRSNILNAGFVQERVDATFEAARIANFQLNKPWHECENLYFKAFKMDESRPDSLYFIGIHYFLENNFKLAHKYFKQAFQIGFPEHCQYSLKPTLSFYFLPKFLCRTSYFQEEYEVGFEASKLFLEKNNYENVVDKNDYNEIISWYKIFEKLNIYKGPKTPIIPEKPILCFVADGGFTSWSGENILTTGVGGSETYIIEIAKYLSQTNYFGEVIVFCNTPNKEEKFFEGTRYIHLDNYYQFINTTYIHTVIISRYSEYIPLTIKGFSENIYIVVHDLTTSGVVIPHDQKIKQIFCLTEWHTQHFTSIFNIFKPITTHFYYGIDENNFRLNYNKIKHKFIYSSFPNRGLLQLLQMWPNIYNKYPSATLYIYSDVNNAWSNEVEPEKMNEIKKLLLEYSNNFGIYYKGWVSKKELADAWATSDIWFYPCTFKETFCLTALEAASSKTLVVTNGLAALQNTVSDRGVIIEGDTTTDEWKIEALNKLFYYMDDSNIQSKQELIDKNYNWAYELTWKNQANKLLNDYLIPNSTFEYKGMYNWTNDIPEGSLNIFTKIINNFNNSYWKIQLNKEINILEIGTYTGTSLIKFVQNIPNSKGIGIDLWQSYNENTLLSKMDKFDIKGSFYKNIKTAGLNNRIKCIQMDSKKALIYFLKDKVSFDFIYVDGSHLLLDAYTDIILAWEILEKGGIMIIDDYLYKQDEVLNSPFEAVNHFLNLYKETYKLLHTNYRVFLEKL